MACFALYNEEWSMIEPLLPAQGRGPQRTDDSKILNRIFYILRTGAPWHDLPEQYGAYTTVYNRYNRWSERSIWKGILDALVEEVEDSLIFIDASIVKCPQSRPRLKKGELANRARY